jgi:hypothetical protein
MKYGCTLAVFPVSALVPLVRTPTCMSDMQIRAVGYTDA